MLEEQDIERIRKTFPKCDITINENEIVIMIRPGFYGTDGAVNNKNGSVFLALYDRSKEFQIVLRDKIGIDFVFKFDKQIALTNCIYPRIQKELTPDEREEIIRKMEEKAKQRPLAPDEIEIFQGVDMSNQDDVMEAASKWFVYLKEKNSGGIYHLTTNEIWLKKKKAYDDFLPYAGNISDDGLSAFGPPDKYDGGTGFCSVTYFSKSKNEIVLDSKNKNVRETFRRLFDADNGFAYEAGITINGTFLTLIF